MKRAKSIQPNRRQQGFTVIELMITVTLVAILASVAVPSMRTYALNGRITSTTQELTRSIQLARSEAMKRQANVIICTSNNPTGVLPICTHTANATGWIVFVDSDNSWTRSSATETLIEAHSFDSTKIVVTADNSQRISYGASGFASVDGATATTQTKSTGFVVCDSRGNVDSNGIDTTTTANSVARGIDVANTGRIRMIHIISDIDAKLSSANGDCPT